MESLSPMQRIRRRISLLGGSYTHADGHIELDFESPAGIDGRRDSQALQEAKLAAYERRRATGAAKVWQFIIGVIVGATLMHYQPALWPF